MGIRVPIYDKQVIPDIARMQPVPMSAANTGAEGIGQAVSGIGQSVEHIANVEMEIQKRRVQMQDTRSLVNFRDEARNKELAIEKYKLSNPDTSTWELFAQKQSEELRKYGETLPISNMGWEQLQPELDSIAGTVDGKTYNAGLLYRKTTLDAVQQEQKNTLSSVEYDLRKKIEAGTSPELSSKEAVDKLSVFMTKDEAELRVRNIADSAMMDRQRIEQGIEKNNINSEMAIAMQLKEPQAIFDYIEKSKLIPETRKGEVIRDAKSRIEINKIDSQRQYDIAIGNNAKDLTALMSQHKLTYDDINVNFETLLNSPMIPEENKKDLLSERDKWITRLDNSTKQVDPAKHNSSKVVDYQNSAQRLTDANEQNKLLGDIEGSIASGEIYESEAKPIRDSLATQLDSNVTKHITQLNSDTHSSFVSTPEQQQKWIQNQMLIATASGVKADEKFYTNMVAKYSEILESRKWASSQAVDEFNSYVREHPELTYDNRTAAAIAIRSDWALKGDVKLVDEYKKYITEQAREANKYRLKPENKQTDESMRPIDKVEMNVIVKPDAKTAGMGDIEFYSPNESDNPSPGKATMAIIHPENWNKLSKQEQNDAIIGEKLHGLAEVDSTYASMRKTFEGMLTSKQNEFDKREYNALVKKGQEDRSFEQWFEVSRLDAYIRGYIVPDKNDEWRKQGVYTNEQKQYLEQIKKYIFGIKK